MYSRVVMVPEEKLGIVILTNSMTGISTALGYELLDRFLGGKKTKWLDEGLERDRQHRKDFYQRIAAATKPRAKDTKPRLPLKKYAGTYSGRLYGDAKVELTDGQLRLRLLPNPDLVASLKHLHYDTFVIEWEREFAWFGKGTAQFVHDDSGKITQLKLNVPNDDLWFYELKLMRR